MIRLWGERKLWFGLLTLVVGFWVALALWPRHTGDSAVHLRILKQTVEHGRQAVFFRVEGDEHRRLRITYAERVIGERLEGPWIWPSGPNPVTVSGFWASPEAMPLSDVTKGRKAFAVFAPTNAPAWTLRIAVDIETPQRWKTMWWRWRSLRSRGKSLSSATSEVWNSFYGQIHEVLDSDVITNAPPL